MIALFFGTCSVVRNARAEGAEGAEDKCQMVAKAFRLIADIRDTGSRRETALVFTTNSFPEIGKIRIAQAVNAIYDNRDASPDRAYDAGYQVCVEEQWLP